MAEAAPEEGGVFTTPQGAPCVARCAVLFLDLLGVTESTRGTRPELNENLASFARAVTRTYRNYMRRPSPWLSSTFSDSLVLAKPIDAPGSEVADIAGLVDQAARLQVSLSEQGFFARGGIAVDWFHLRDGLIFGPALVTAHRLEEREAVHPRVILAEDVAAVMERAAADGNPLANRLLLRDADGSLFVDYLSVLIEDPDDLRPRFAGHRAEIEARLDRHVGTRRVWDKFRWLAEYHNHVVSEVPGLDATVKVAAGRMAWRFRALRL